MHDFRQELENLAHEGLRRTTTPWPETGGRLRGPDGRVLLNFSSNDYLDLAHHPHVVARAKAALDRWGAGATASRLMCGTLDLHEELEAALARRVGGEAALVFSSGFGMNVGLLPALAGRDDVLFADRLNHASLVDGARLSGAEVRRFAHADAAALEERLRHTPCRGRRVVVCESVYSMDGDVPPLEAFARLAQAHGAMLVVDEAHAIGVFGRGGGVLRGLEGRARADLIIGTLGKALGSAGGFVVGSAGLREWLVNRARSFIYATALPPAAAAAALGALECLDEDPALGERLLERARVFHADLAARGVPVGPFQSQIIPVRVGDNQAALALAARLREDGLLVTAIRPPTVPAGTARLRLSVTLAHTPEDLARAAECLAGAFRATEHLP